MLRISPSIPVQAPHSWRFADKLAPADADTAVVSLSFNVKARGRIRTKLSTIAMKASDEFTHQYGSRLEGNLKTATTEGGTLYTEKVQLVWLLRTRKTDPNCLQVIKRLLAGEASQKGSVDRCMEVLRGRAMLQALTFPSHVGFDMLLTAEQLKAADEETQTNNSFVSILHDLITAAQFDDDTSPAPQSAFTPKWQQLWQALSKSKFRERTYFDERLDEDCAEAAGDAIEL